MSEEKTIPLHRERLNLPDKVDQQKVNDIKKKQMSRDFAVVFNSVEGRRVLRFMMVLGGFKRPKIGGNTSLGMDVAYGTIYNAAREQLLLEIFEFVPSYILRDAEYGLHEDLGL